LATWRMLYLLLTRLVYPGELVGKGCGQYRSRLGLARAIWRLWRARGQYHIL